MSKINGKECTVRQSEAQDLWGKAEDSESV